MTKLTSSHAHHTIFCAYTQTPQTHTLATNTQKQMYIGTTNACVRTNTHTHTKMHAKTHDKPNHIPPTHAHNNRDTPPQHPSFIDIDTLFQP